MPALPRWIVFSAGITSHPFSALNADSREETSFSRLYLNDWPYDPFGLPADNIKMLKGLRHERAAALDRPYNRRWWRNAVRLEERRDLSFDITRGVVRFGSSGDISGGEVSVLHAALQDLKSWRKGPFNYTGIDVERNGAAIISGIELWSLRSRSLPDAESQMWAVIISTTCTVCLIINLSCCRL